MDQPTYLIIGDIAGQLDALERLIAKAPEHDHRIYLGDVIDRGEKAIETLLYVKNDVRSGKATLVYGNHEDLMVETIVKGKDSKRYPWEYNSWMRNGGHSTFEGFKKLTAEEQVDVLKFLTEETELYVQGPGFICSHAPMKAKLQSVDHIRRYLGVGEEAVFAFLWNREGIAPWWPEVQFYGHNGVFTEHVDHGNYDRKFAYCVDDTFNGNIAAVHWPSRTVVKEAYRNVPEIPNP